MGNWDGFDMQAQLHPGFVPDTCVAEVPGRPIGPAQHFDISALTLVRCIRSDLLLYLPIF